MWRAIRAQPGIATRIGSGKLRHLAIRDLWVQEKVRAGELKLGKVKSEDNTSDLGTKHLDLQRVLKLVEMTGLKFGEVKRAGTRGLAAVTLLAQPRAAAAAGAEAETNGLYAFIRFDLVIVVVAWLVGSLALCGARRLGLWGRLHLAAGDPAGPLPGLPMTAVIGAGPTARREGGAAAAAPSAAPAGVHAPVEVRGSGSLLESSCREASGAAAAAADEERIAPLLRVPQYTYADLTPIGLGIRRRGVAAMGSAPAAASTRSSST